MNERSTGVMVREDRAVAAPQGFTRDQVDLIKRTVAIGATDDELQMFINQAQRMGLDPFAKQIHFVKRGSGSDAKGTIQVAIDGYRLIADRTGKYAGNDDPIFEGETDGHPVLARVTVWKLVQGVRCPFTVTARWVEYVPKGNQGFMWTRMPYVMLGKCAEALALRKAFPAELSGSYVDAEMDQADIPTAQPPQPQPEPVRPPQVMRGQIGPSVGPQQQYLRNRKELEEAASLADLSASYTRMQEEYRQNQMDQAQYRALYDVKEARKAILLQPVTVDPTTGEMDPSEAAAEDSRES